MAELTVEERLDGLEKQVDNLLDHFIKSYLYYCKKLECQYCGHNTLQSGLMLQGETEMSYQCLNCGKVWHKDQKIVEYTKKI